MSATAKETTTNAAGIPGSSPLSPVADRPAIADRRAFADGSAADADGSAAAVDPAVRDSTGPDVVALDSYRRELTGFCYRMLGSAADAEDAVQEIMLRAWRAAPGFEGRSSLRSWLYRIASNVCLDQLRGRSRRASPAGLGRPSAPDGDLLGPELPEHAWISPVPDARVLPDSGDPADLAVARETIRLAFVTALQHLPPRQRAVLVLSQVLRFGAAEIADQLDSTVPAVNSALQRARATLAALPSDARPDRPGAGQARLLAQYVEAFERYDIDAFVRLLQTDVVQSMPPYAMWLRGAPDIGAWMLGPGAGCRGSRLVPVAANGGPAFGQYRLDPGGGYAAFSLHVPVIAADRIAQLNYFLDVGRLFPLFGLPSHLDG